MKRKVAVVTGSRADYGLLYWIMKEIQQSEDLELQLIVTGMHLSPEYGRTYKMILQDEFEINSKVDMLLSGDSSAAVSKSMGIGMIGFAQVYEELKPDIVLVLGDRYEILAAVTAAVPFNIVIAHIHGGEVTEGAIDEQIRHAITKMSHLHFASTEKYADNIIKMGECSENVFCTGAPGLEWIDRMEYIHKEQLEKELEVEFDRGAILATFHPVTLELDNTELYIDNVIEALIESGMQVIFSGANSDPSGAIINGKLRKTASQYRNFKFFENLGHKKYLSCQRNCTLMLGNSSSGIIEAASFGLPVVNIGNRQSGRLQSKNVINVSCDTKNIMAAINKAKSIEFRSSIAGLVNIYGDGNVAGKIESVLRNTDISKIKYKKLCYR